MEHTSTTAAYPLPATHSRSPSTTPTPTIHVPMDQSDLEKPDYLSKLEAAQPEQPHEKVDIEHARVENDPRGWSKSKKMFILVLVSAASMIGGLGASIYNPAIAEIESELHTTASQISLSLSIFILFQGGFPVMWSAVSEIIGRKKVYLVSMTLNMVGCVVAATAKDIRVLIGMRCIQGAGGAAVMSIGAATLADIYEPHQRGTMMGIYYCAPLIGGSLGPLLGGVLTQGLNWRATFYFLAIFSGLCVLAFIAFEDTFRKERSAVYSAAVRRRLHDRERKALKEAKERELGSHGTVVEKEVNGKEEDAESEETRNEKLAGHELAVTKDTGLSSVTPPIPQPKDAKEVKAELHEVRLSLRDVNPIGPMVLGLRKYNNLAILTASGLIYGFTYCVAYTCSRILGSKYGFDALKIGLVLLSYGVGSMFGSILGGRWSDRVFKKIKAKNGGISQPEMRLISTRVFMIFLPPAVVGYGWVCEEHVNVSVICVMLFLSGFLCISIYSCTLAYIVDANVGRSSSAVALNSCFRGTAGFIAAEVAVPLQNSMGEGGLYSLWAGLLVISEMLILLVWWRGGRWREEGEEREARQADA